MGSIDKPGPVGQPAGQVMVSHNTTVAAKDANRRQVAPKGDPLTKVQHGRIAKRQATWLRRAFKELARSFKECTDLELNTGDIEKLSPDERKVFFDRLRKNIKVNTLESISVIGNGHDATVIKETLGIARELSEKNPSCPFFLQLAWDHPCCGFLENSEGENDFGNVTSFKFFSVDFPNMRAIAEAIDGSKVTRAEIHRSHGLSCLEAFIRALIESENNIETIVWSRNHSGKNRLSSAPDPTNYPFAVARAFSDVITQKNSKLIHLSLERTPLCREGIASLGSALEHENCQLKILDLRRAGIRFPEMRRILAAAARAKNLEILDLRYNDWNEGSDTDNSNSLTKLVEEAKKENPGLEIRWGGALDDDKDMEWPAPLHEETDSEDEISSDSESSDSGAEES